MCRCWFLHICIYIYSFLIGWTTSASGNEKQALEQLQRNRGSMAAVLQLQELPEIEADSSDLNHMRVQEFVTWQTRERSRVGLPTTYYILYRYNSPTDSNSIYALPFIIYSNGTCYIYIYIYIERHILCFFLLAWRFCSSQLSQFIYSCWIAHLEHQKYSQYSWGRWDQSPLVPSASAWHRNQSCFASVDWERSWASNLHLCLWAWGLGEEDRQTVCWGQRAYQIAEGEIQSVGAAVWAALCFQQGEKEATDGGKADQAWQNLRGIAAPSFRWPTAPSSDSKQWITIPTSSSQGWASERESSRGGAFYWGHVLSMAVSKGRLWI